MKFLVLGLFWLLCAVAWATEEPTNEDPDPVLVFDNEQFDAQPIAFNVFTVSDTTYGFSKTKLTWHEAQLFCAKRGYYLASIPSEAIQTQIASLIRSVDSVLPSLYKEIVWTSGTNQADSSQYLWHNTGAAVTYQNYRTVPSGSSRCLALNAITEYWTAENCRDKHYFVCEIICPTDDE